MPLKASRKHSSRRTKGRKAPTLAKLKKTAWKLLSELVRRSNSFQGNGPCYTCGQVWDWRLIHAGHAIPGRTGITLLDEEIIRPQCQRCNIWLGGNYPVFVTKLIREKAAWFGQMAIVGEAEIRALDWWEAKLQASRQVRKWSRSELEEKIDNYKARLNGL